MNKFIKSMIGVSCLTASSFGALINQIGNDLYNKFVQEAALFEEGNDYREHFLNFLSNQNNFFLNNLRDILAQNARAFSDPENFFDVLSMLTNDPDLLTTLTLKRIEYLDNEDAQKSRSSTPQVIVNQLHSGLHNLAQQLISEYPANIGNLPNYREKVLKILKENGVDTSLLELDEIVFGDKDNLASALDNVCNVVNPAHQVRPVQFDPALINGVAQQMVRDDEAKKAQEQADHELAMRLDTPIRVDFPEHKDEVKEMLPEFILYKDEKAQKRLVDIKLAIEEKILTYSQDDAQGIHQLKNVFTEENCEFIDNCVRDIFGACAGLILSYDVENFFAALKQECEDVKATGLAQIYKEVAAAKTVHEYLDQYKEFVQDYNVIEQESHGIPAILFNNAYNLSRLIESLAERRGISFIGSYDLGALKQNIKDNWELKGGCAAGICLRLRSHIVNCLIWFYMYGPQLIKGDSKTSEERSKKLENQINALISQAEGGKSIQTITQFSAQALPSIYSESKKNVEKMSKDDMINKAEELVKYYENLVPNVDTYPNLIKEIAEKLGLQIYARSLTFALKNQTLLNLFKLSYQLSCLLDQGIIGKDYTKKLADNIKDYFKMRKDRTPEALSEKLTEHLRECLIGLYNYHQNN